MTTEETVVRVSSERLGKAPDYIILARDECTFKLRLQDSRNYAIQTQAFTRVTGESSKAEERVVPSLPLAQSPGQVVSFSLSPPPSPEAGGAMLVKVEEKGNGRGRQKIVVTVMEGKNCLAGRREICYSKQQQQQKLPKNLKMIE